MVDRGPAAYATNFPSGEIAGSISSPDSKVICVTSPSVTTSRVGRASTSPPATTITTPATPALLNANLRHRGTLATAATGWVPVGVIPPLGVVNVSSCCSSSSALSHRSAGCFSRHRITSAVSGPGTAGRWTVTGSGVWVTCAESVAWGVAPMKGGLPHSIS